MGKRNKLNIYFSLLGWTGPEGLNKYLIKEVIKIGYRGETKAKTFELQKNVAEMLEERSKIEGRPQTRIVEQALLQYISKQEAREDG